MTGEDPSEGSVLRPIGALARAIENTSGRDFILFMVMMSHRSNMTEAQQKISGLVGKKIKQIQVTQFKTGDVTYNGVSANQGGTGGTKTVIQFEDGSEVEFGGEIRSVDGKLIGDTSVKPVEVVSQ